MATPDEATDRPERRGPVEGEHVIGIDADPAARPGAPMVSDPDRDQRDPGHPQQDQEEGAERKLTRVPLDRPTPVFGTAQPPKGLAGALRGAAYSIPEHYARRWMFLMLADRLDVVESGLGRRMARPLERAGAAGPAERVRAHPVPVLAGAVLGLWLTKRLLS